MDERGRRILIAPAPVKGRFRRARDITYGILIFIFLVVPWTSYNGRQTIWLDLAHRKFHFFDLTLFAHDGPLVFFVLALAAFAIIAATAIWGRVWCGWACPQTVFIDAIYRRIEGWIEGDYKARRQLHNAPWSGKKLGLKTLKWVLFFVVSSHIAHSLVAYFVGAHNLIWVTLEWPTENWTLFIIVQFLSFLFLFDFGWFREQFCLIACPYGRFQSALMDKHSLAVHYDTERGEPRRGKRIKPSGDCVNCFRCVNVCPTGIDIRDGLQMECIHCTACIDACDEIMERVNKPKGLIRYSSEAQLGGEKQRRMTSRRWAYLGILIVLSLGLVISLSLRQGLEVKVLRATESPYRMVTDTEGKPVVLNHFRFHVTNQSRSSIELRSLELDAPKSEVVSPTLRQELASGQSVWVHVFVRFPKKILVQGRFKSVWTLKYKGASKKEYYGEVPLIGP